MSCWHSGVQRRDQPQPQTRQVWRQLRNGNHLSGQESRARARNTAMGGVPYPSLTELPDNTGTILVTRNARSMEPSARLGETALAEVAHGTARNRRRWSATVQRNIRRHQGQATPVRWQLIARIPSRKHFTWISIRLATDRSWRPE